MSDHILLHYTVRNMKPFPKSVTITLALLLLNAIFWFGYPVYSIFLDEYLSSIPEVLRWAILILALGSSIILTLIAFLLKRRNRWGGDAGVLMLALMAVLSITDEFGVLDFVSLLILSRWG